MTAYKKFSNLFENLSSCYRIKEIGKSAQEISHVLVEQIKSSFNPDFAANIAIIELSDISFYKDLHGWQEIFNNAAIKNYYGIVQGKGKYSRYVGVFFKSNERFYRVQLKSEYSIYISVTEELESYLQLTSLLYTVGTTTVETTKEISLPIEERAKKAINNIEELITKCSDSTFWEKYGDVYTYAIFPDSRGNSRPFIFHPGCKSADVIKEITAYLDSDENVLIIGPPGAGKGMVARAFHYIGKRKKSPFIEVNIPSIASTETLAQDQLKGWTLPTRL